MLLTVSFLTLILEDLTTIENLSVQGAPASSVVTEGPAIENVSKSSLSQQISIEEKEALC